MSLDVDDDTRSDAVAYLTVWLVLLYTISANQVFGPLGALGPPAFLASAGATFLWAANRFLIDDSPRGVQPLRLVLLAWCWYQLATVVRAYATRPLSVLELSGSVREALTVVLLTGVALLVIDDVRSIGRLETLLRRLVWAGAFLATHGILQFATGSGLELRIPGLSLNTESALVGERGIFNRPAATTLHPIEFSVVLAALFPLALHFAIEGERGSRQRKFAIAATVLIGLGIPLSISRSGIVAVVAGLAVLALGWDWRRRAQLAVVGLLVVPVLWLSIPGLVGTFASLFGDAQYDPSVTARIQRIPVIMAFIREHAWFGFGAGTFSVEEYLLVDNEFWVSSIATGFVGIFLTLFLHLTAGVASATSRFHVRATRQTAELGMAIAAAIAALTASMFTFDAFFYKILRGTLFLLIGASGALWRLTRDPPGQSTDHGPRREARAVE